ncbi:MAG: aspartate--tRNA(Asn) ligase, partial [Methanomicrobiales archaeon]|nr:aspartate--tRNA(Asn) ligase [Methanomicrobiales archaeon]
MRQPIQAVTPESESADITGWVHEIRDLGGLTFLLVRDRTGIIQVTIPKKKVPPEVAETARNISRESVIRVRGGVKAIQKAPGGREIVPEELDIISAAESP